MAQLLRLGMYLAFIPFAIPLAGAARVIEAVTGKDPMAGAGVQHEPYGPTRPAGGHKHGRNNNCTCGTVHD